LKPPTLSQLLCEDFAGILAMVLSEVRSGHVQGAGLKGQGGGMTVVATGSMSKKQEEPI
jgi:hypothetical protein